MAPAKKRETRDNQFFDVGVQGRKTGITLEDRGVRDEHGLEPISGIFSSPEKSPPKRGSNRTGATLTESEPMELTSPIPQPAESAVKLLRSARTHLPPPKARSPIKTTLGSSPRRQSPLGPRAQALPTSSPSRSASHPFVSRRLDFEQEESSIQETPALNGSAKRRGQRRSVYSLEPSPSRITSSAMLEESIQEEIIAGEGESMLDAIAEESGLQDIGNDTGLGAEAEDVTEADSAADVNADAETEITADVEESEVAPEPVKEPAKRGRKRKNAPVEPVQAEEEAPAPAPKKRGRKPLEKKDQNAAPAPAGPSRRSKRVSEISEQEPSILADASSGALEEVEAPSVVSRGRGRPLKAAASKDTAQMDMPPPAKNQKRQSKEQEKETEEPVFKKPKAPLTQKKKAGSKPNAAQQPAQESVESGNLVDINGNPISKADLDQMSTGTTGTRFGRGRHLSVFRELDPDSVGTVGRTGRHRVAPMNFWENERVAYDHEGNMERVLNAVPQEAPRKPRKVGRKPGKRSLSAIEEEDDNEQDIQPWEEEGDGKWEGSYKVYDAANKITTGESLLTVIAWSEKAIKPIPIASGFKFIKLGSALSDDNHHDSQPFLGWGFMEFEEGQMKKARNAGSQYMVMHVQSGVVEVKIHENVLVVRRGGVFQVPRGNFYSIKNVGSKTSRIFYVQGAQTDST